MRSAIKYLLTGFLLMLSLSVGAQRSSRSQDPTLNRGDGLEKNRNDLAQIRNDKQNENARQQDIYMFASAFSLIDSVLYVSDVQLLEDVTVNNRWFIKERSSFESQFHDYVSGNDETYLSSIFFSDKKKKSDKRRARLIRRNNKKNGFKLIEVHAFEFSNVTAAPEQDTPQYEFRF